MIKLEDLTPEIYYKQSRDFQFIGRLYDIVLNSVKTNAENIYYTPISDNSDERLIDLMTLTLGFKSKHSYNVKQLTALCSAFAEVIRNKGSWKSIELACNALYNAEGVTDKLDYSILDNNTLLVLYVPKSIKDINLLKDLMDYVLPAGMSYKLVREVGKTRTAETEVGTEDTVTKFEALYNNTYSKVVDDNTTIEQIIEPLVSNTLGIGANSMIYNPEKPDTPPTEEEENK